MTRPVVRLQIQYRSNEYNGTWDAGRKILRTEGVRGLYRGFFVSAFQVVSGVFYVSTYEGVRHFLDSNRYTKLHFSFFGLFKENIQGKNLQSKVKAKSSWQKLLHCQENWLVKTFPTIPHNLHALWSIRVFSKYPVHRALIFSPKSSTQNLTHFQ